jgi:hypothetical protein
MHIAARSGLLLPLLLLQLALPARAQTGAATPSIPPDTLPPEPTAEKAEPAAQPPEPASPPPEYNLAPPALPLSSQILQINASPWQVSRGGIEVPDLVLAVAGSPRAENMIRKGQEDVSTGSFLSTTGLVIWIGSLIAGLAASANTPHPTDAQSSAIGGGTLAGVLAGVVVELVGDGIRGAGLRRITEGVNAYNADLLDDRLVSPAAVAVPPR